MNLQNKVVSHIDLYTDLGTGGRPAFIYAKQYDAKSRYIIATIKNGDQKIEVKGTARFNVKKPDGTFFYADGQINDDSTVTVEIDSQILAVDGEVSCDISIFDGDIPDRAILTTSTFFIIVEKSNYDLDAIKSSNIYIDLDAAKVDAQESATKAEEAMSAAEISSGIASDAAKAAKEAADRAELAGGGISIEVDSRLKELEQWMYESTYEPMTASLFVTPSSIGYDDTVTEVLLNWTIDKETSSIILTLPDGSTVDVTGRSSYTDTTTYSHVLADKEWSITATRKDGKHEPATASAIMQYDTSSYKKINATLSVSKPTIEYGDTVTDVVVSWAVDKEASSIELILPNGNKVDVTNITSPYTDTTIYSNVTANKTWSLIANRKDGKQETTTATATMTCSAYTAIKFNSFVMTPSTTEYELGTSVSDIKFNWELNKPAKLITVNGTALEDASDTEYVANGTFTSNTSWTVEATEKIGKNKSATITKSIEFSKYRVYWGLGTQTSDFDSDFVKGLRTQGTELTTTKSRTLTFDRIDSKYVYYAIPKDLGTPVFQIGEAGFPGGFESGIPITVKTEAGVSIEYYLYRSIELLEMNEPLKICIS